MGCDIHLYLEYKRKDLVLDKFSWGSFGRLHVNRNYRMFGLLCKGVRTDPEKGFEPKGLPDQLGYFAEGDNRLFISDTPNEEYVTLEKAKEWEKQGNKIIEFQGKPTWVEHPDWHSHSWFTTEEFETVLTLYNKNEKHRDAEYEAVLAAMKRFEELHYACRIVFWFDN